MKVRVYPASPQSQRHGRVRAARYAPTTPVEDWVHVHVFQHPKCDCVASYQPITSTIRRVPGSTSTGCSLTMV